MFFLPASAGTPALTCVRLRGAAACSSNGRLIGPGAGNFGFSVYKNNRIKSIPENSNVQFGAEFFRITHHPDFAVPSPDDGNIDIFDAQGNLLAGAGGADAAFPGPSSKASNGMEILHSLLFLFVLPANSAGRLAQTVNLACGGPFRRDAIP